VIGSTVSRYRVLSKLGGGGMGIVYEAEDAELGRRVAIKFLPGGATSSGEAMERFRREARAASALDHPHICTVFDVGEHEGQPFLVMERLRGRTLKHVIASSVMPIDDVVRLGEQFADALDAAHRAGIIHRDLKPANLFVLERGDGKVLDFGLAKVTVSDAASGEVPTVALEHLTEAGAMLGTVAYMSPEQARGKTVDARSDTFSLGVVLYEMATGRSPFPGESAAERFAALLDRKPVPPRAHNPLVPPRLEEVILKALEKEPGLRYQTAADLRSDLRRLGRDSSGSGGTYAPAEPPATVAATSRAPTRTRRAVWLAAAALTLCALAVAAYLSTRGGSGEVTASAGAVRGPDRSIAVLPFADMSEKKDQEYFADGLAEELLVMLSRIPALKVSARSSSFSFKGQRTTVSEVARVLGVLHVLEGSVRKSGDRLRVSAQLVRASDGFQLWSETYDRHLDDVFVVQDEIAGAVVRALELKLLEAEMPKATTTDSHEAYALFLQARALHYRGTHADNVTGIAYLERALGLDPDFAPAWFGLGDALVYDFVSFGAGSHDEVRRRAAQAAANALRLAPKQADSHLLNARVLGELDWDWPAALAEMKRAVELDPNNSLALWQVSQYSLILDRLDDALDAARRMMAIDVASWGTHFAMGDVLMRMGRIADAEASYRKSTELSPTSANIHTLLGIALLGLEHKDEALEAMNRETDEAWRHYGMTLALDRLGRKQEANRELAALEADFASSKAWSIGSIHACRGEPDAAFSWFERAYRQRDGWLPLIKSDPCVGRLTADPRYSALLRQLGLPAS